MSSLTGKGKRKALIWVIVAAVVVVAVVAACAIYLNDYYRADVDAIAAFALCVWQ